MILISHILIALFSVIFTAFTSFFPSQKKLIVSYIFVGFTILSGTYLIFIKPAHMVTTCFEGLVYIAVISVAIIFAQRKLASNKV